MKVTPFIFKTIPAPYKGREKLDSFLTSFKVNWNHGVSPGTMGSALEM